MESVDAVGHPCRWPSEVEVDNGDGNALPEDDVPGAVVLVRHELWHIEQWEHRHRRKTGDAAPNSVRRWLPTFGRIVQAADQLAKADKHDVARRPRGQRLDRHVPLDEAQDLAALFVVAQRLRDEVDAVRPDVAQVRVHRPREGADRPPHRLADPHDVGDTVVVERVLLLVHSGTVVRAPEDLPAAPISAADVCTTGSEADALALPCRPQHLVGLGQLGEEVPELGLLRVGQGPEGRRGF